MDFKNYIREVPDFPKKGILFYDITTLLDNPSVFDALITEMAKTLENVEYDKIIGIEARGFIFGAALALKLKKSFIPLRKKGKLPYKTISHTYSLEYGEDTVEMHEDAVKKGEKILIVDDLLATGGTVNAAVKLVKKSGGETAKVLFAIELDFLKGRELFKDINVESIIHY